MDEDTRFMVGVIVLITIIVSSLCSLGAYCRYCSKQETIKLAEQGYYYSQKDSNIKKIGE